MCRNVPKAPCTSASQTNHPTAPLWKVKAQHPYLFHIIATVRMDHFAWIRKKTNVSLLVRTLGLGSATPRYSRWAPNNNASCAFLDSYSGDTACVIWNRNPPYGSATNHSRNVATQRPTCIATHSNAAQKHVSGAPNATAPKSPLRFVPTRIMSPKTGGV